MEFYHKKFYLYHKIKIFTKERNLKQNKAKIKWSPTDLTQHSCGMLASQVAGSFTHKASPLYF